MKIGVIGVGNIGAILTQRLSTASHEVVVANSRGPETVPVEVLAAGGRAAHASEAVQGADVVIFSVPLVRIPDLHQLVADLPDETVLIDTSNYYPLRDGHIKALDDGQVESLWVSEQLGRTVVKAWNAITSMSFEAKAAEPGTPGRLAIPVAADDRAQREVAMSLVEETGFDASYSGTLDQSWRQQPGAPCYCTELTLGEMPAALAATSATRSPRRRDLAMTVIVELMNEPTPDLPADFVVQVNRLLYR